MFTLSELQQIYTRRAHWYDVSANLYRLIGFREQHYRQMAVQNLELKQGDCVVELGCGTGLNFPLLQKAVGPSGKIIGIDLTDAMLDVARRKIESAGWRNVELFHGDAHDFKFPRDVKAVFSTFAFTLIPEHAQLTRRIATSLRPGSRMVILDLKKAQHWPHWIFRLALWMTAPFAVTEEYAEQHPWEEMHKQLKNFNISELFFGGAYIASGEVP